MQEKEYEEQSPLTAGTLYKSFDFFNELKLKPADMLTILTWHVAIIADYLMKNKNIPPKKFMKDFSLQIEKMIKQGDIEEMELGAKLTKRTK